MYLILLIGKIITCYRQNIKVKFNTFWQSYFADRKYKTYSIEIPSEEIESQACCWKTEETIWRHIGTVDSLEAARYLVENDRGSYKDSEGNVYYLECEPSDELFYSFAKIEYGDTVEYYDWYVPGKETRYGRRIIRN